MTGKEIVAIIQAGSKYQVATLELEALKITFKNADTNLVSKIPTTTLINTSDEEVDLGNEKQSLQQELDEHLLNLTDPLAYEDLKLIG